MIMALGFLPGAFWASVPCPWGCPDRAGGWMQAPEYRLPTAIRPAAMTVPVTRGQPGLTLAAMLAALDGRPSRHSEITPCDRESGVTRSETHPKRRFGAEAFPQDLPGCLVAGGGGRRALRESGPFTIDPKAIVRPAAAGRAAAFPRAW